MSSRGHDPLTHGQARSRRFCDDRHSFKAQEITPEKTFGYGFFLSLKLAVRRAGLDHGPGASQHCARHDSGDGRASPAGLDTTPKLNSDPAAPTWGLTKENGRSPDKGTGRCCPSTGLDSSAYFWICAVLRSSSKYACSFLRWVNISTCGLTSSNAGTSGLRVSSRRITCQPNSLCTGTLVY
jgi:hypothetical protein